MGLKIGTGQLKAYILKFVTTFFFTNFAYKKYEFIEGGCKSKNVHVEKSVRISYQGTRYVHFSYCTKANLQIFFNPRKQNS